MHAPVQPKGLPHVSDMQELKGDLGTKLDPGIASEVGEHVGVTGPIGNEEGGEIAMQPPDSEVTPVGNGPLKNDGVGMDVNETGETGILVMDWEDWNTTERPYGTTWESNFRRIDTGMTSGTHSQNIMHSSEITVVDVKTKLGIKDLDGRKDVNITTRWPKLYGHGKSFVKYEMNESPHATRVEHQEDKDGMVGLWGLSFFPSGILRHRVSSPLMPRKKDPPPSALPPRRSNRGASKSASHVDGEDTVPLVVPIVGLGETQEGLAASSQPPPLPPNTVACDTNKESSGIPSVSVSSNTSEQALGSFSNEESEKSVDAGKPDLAGKLGLARCMAGLSVSDSSGSPGVQVLYTDGGNCSSSMNAPGGVGYAVANSRPRRTPLFSPEFKAMLGRDYPKTRTVFGPSAEAVVGSGLWEGKPKHAESEGVSVTHSSGMHAPVQPKGLPHVSDMQELQGDLGTKLDPGITSEVGEHVGVTGPIGNEEIGEIAMQPPDSEVTPVGNGPLKNDGVRMDVNETGETGILVMDWGDWNTTERPYGTTWESNFRRFDTRMTSGTHSQNIMHSSEITVVDVKTKPGIKDLDGRKDVNITTRWPKLYGHGKSFVKYEMNESPHATRVEHQEDQDGVVAASPHASSLPVESAPIGGKPYTGGSLATQLASGATDGPDKAPSQSFGALNLRPKELPLSMRGQCSSPLTINQQPLSGAEGRWEYLNLPTCGALGSSGSAPVTVTACLNPIMVTQTNPTPMDVTLQQCMHRPKPAVVVVVGAATSGTPPQKGQVSVSDAPIAPSSTTNASAPSVDEDGFTMVSRHKKRGPIKLQSKNQKPVRVKVASQQYGSGRSRKNIGPSGLGDRQKGGAPLAKHQATRVDGNNEPNLVPIAPKKVAPGFNYSRAIHGGGKDSPNQQPAPPACPVPGVGSSDRSNDMGVDSASRFSVLDIPNSIKFNKLITGQNDLYPPDQGMADSMEVEVNVLNSNGIYGISDAQKQVILNCMRDFKYVQAEAVEEWSQGEWDCFADKCMELGLDPENSILYPEEDTEIVDDEDMDGFELAHDVSQLKKLGSYSDPVVTKYPNLLLVRLGRSPSVMWRCLSTDIVVTTDFRGNGLLFGSCFKGLHRCGIHVVGCIWEATKDRVLNEGSQAACMVVGTTRVTDELHDRAKFDFGTKPTPRETLTEADQNKIGLKFLDNGVVLATSQQMEEDPGADTSTPESGNSSTPASINKCVMNTNDVIPLSPKSDNKIPEITMLPVDLNPRFDELTGPKGNYQRQMGENCSNPPEIPTQVVGNDEQLVTQENGNEGFTTVTRKRRRLKIKVQGKQLVQNRQNSVTKRIGQKGEIANQGPPPSTSSDPVIQRKMNDLHKNFIASSNHNRRDSTDGTNNRNPTHPDKGKKTHHTSIRPLHIPSSTTHYIPKHPHTANPSNPPSNKPNPPRKPQSSPKPSAAIAASRMVSIANRFTVLDSVMTDCTTGPHCNPSEDQTKIYEFSEDTIENVLKFKPSALSIPRVNDSNLDLGESLGQDMTTDVDIPDFDITNAQKKVIASRLEKFGVVKAVDQEDWSQGEWEYFHHLRNSMQIDPNTSVEDVDSDSNGTARFFKYQLEKDRMGEQEMHAPTNPLTI
ncbi:hypothetical protein L1987_14068 [Smallanthus sonchifolius]|uniref:Uncharacterized protein n=1 Tax=Smallanthus sonchifolius TaxID=185202 RepID=A0ACB9J418_9ASTR|nr:hypothetical protein L1987_14068 [Smallanthus sonchifolius]